MKMTIEELKAKTKLFQVGTVSQEEINNAENQLNLHFTEEYKNYLSNYGAISFGAHEITGLGVSGYLNVVTATEKERNLGGDFPKDCILLENNGIDGILTIMDEKGFVYSFNGKEKKQIAVSFSNFLKELI